MTHTHKEIRALVDAATDGEWYASEEYSQDYYHSGYAIGTDEDGCDIVFYGIDEKADARFIAASRQIIPQLLDEVEAKDKEIEMLKRKLEVCDYAFDLCHRYNGNSKRDYYNQAQQALGESHE